MSGMFGLSDQEYLRSKTWPRASGVDVHPGPESGWLETSSGLIVPESSLPKLPLAVDLFCGCGGFTLGTIAAGFDVIAGAEWDFTAAMTYLANLATYPCQIIFLSDEDEERFTRELEKDRKKYQREHGVDGLSWYCGSARADVEFLAPGYRGVRYFFFGDLSQANGEEMLAAMDLRPGDLDLVMGGPPCQGFSKAGKASPNDPHNNLTFEFARLIVEMQPRSMCMENVPEMVNQVTPWGTKVLDEFLDIIERGNYAVHARARKLWEQDPEGRRLVKRTRPSAEVEQPDPEDSGQQTLFAEAG